MLLRIAVILILVWPQDARPQGVSGADRRAAATLMKQGNEAFRLGEFAQAIEHFKESYRKDPRPLALFNVAQVYRQQKDHENALFFYQRYLMEAPNAEDRAIVERRIDELKKTIESKRASEPVPPGAGTEPPPPVAPPPETTPPVAPPPEPVKVAPPAEVRPRVAEPTPAPPAEAPASSDRGSGRKLIAYTVGGVGVAAIGVGVVTSLLAVSKKNDAGCEDDGRCPTQEAVDTLSSARSMGNVATVAFGVGMAALATGVVLYLTAPKGTEVRAAIAPGAGTLSIVGAF